jgi:hypothetical protein
MNDLGLRWEIFVDEVERTKACDGRFYANNRKIVELYQLPNHCVKCLSQLSFNDEFDSTFCADCDEWREASCGDPLCDFCLDRPTKPSDCK